MNRRLPSRQVHLDFHTSEYIENIGRDFNKKQFQEVLQEGHVNSITVFGKCHHGYFYYPTKVGEQHPGLRHGQDLAGEMMEACHEIGVFAPLYLTLGWSELDVHNHPEWIARAKDGACMGLNYDFSAKPEDARPEACWVHLCSVGGYRQYIYDMTKEACERYEKLDGLFFDIVFSYDVCYCDSCLAGMREMGLNPEIEEDAKKYYQIRKKELLDGIREILFSYHPEASLFFNSGGAEIHMPQWHYASTHFEMEDLPTVWGGYDKMPMRARYFARRGKDYLGMTGKFHRSWGEFGGYKTPEALRFECASMVANGARCSVGDQLHPYGKMDIATYKNIGYAYSYVEQIEEYCFDTQETAKLGVLVSTTATMNEAMAKLLLDCHVDFDVVHNETDLERFDTIIIPANYRLNDKMGAAFEAFVKQDGKVLILGGGGLKEYEDEFAFSTPFEYIGKSEYEKDYFEINAEVENDKHLETEDLTDQIVKAPILCYSSAHRVRGNGEVLSYIRQPFFNRTYGKFCSHYNAPYIEEHAEYPGAIRCGNILYVAHELSDLYMEYGSVYHRRYFKWLLRKLYKADYVRVEMPTQGRIHFVKREQKKQYVLHLTYGVPVRRGDVEVVEEFPILYNVPVEILVPEEVESIKMIPQNQEITFKKTQSGYRCIIPEMSMHQMVVITIVS